MDPDSPTPQECHPWFERPWIPEFTACGIAGLAYLATLWFGFAYDDTPQILKNPAIQSWHHLPQYFTSHVWAAIYPNSTGNYYRPLFLLWLRLNYAVFGINPFGWHATSVVCHVVATYLVFRVVGQLTSNRRVPCAAALIFGVHPAHIENVAWISGVTDPLMACFVLGSCTAFLSFRELRRTSSLILSLALFGCAVLSKETAAVTPALIFGLAMFAPPHAGRGGDQQAKTLTALRETAPYVLLGVLYLVVRYRALGGFTHATISISWKEVFLTWPAVLWFYAQHLLFPVRLSEFYPLDYVRNATTQLVVLPLLFLLALGVVLYFLIRSLQPKQAVQFALLLIVLPLLPVLDLRSLTAGDIAHDRYLYLPSAGFALLAAISICELGPRLPDRYRSLTPTALTGILVLLFTALTVSQQAQWNSDIALYTRGIESAPNNLTVRDNLANAWLGANQPDRAIPLYLEVLQRNSNFWRSNYNLGYAYYKTGNYTGAEDYLQRAIRIDSTDSDQFIYLALVQFHAQKVAKAAENARVAVAKNPQARGYHFILGLTEEANGDRDAAIAAFKAELSLYPNNAPAAAEMQKMQGNAANPQPGSNPK